MSNLEQEVLKINNNLRDKHTDRCTKRHKNRHRERHTNRNTDRNTKNSQNRHKDTQTELFIVNIYSYKLIIEVSKIRACHSINLTIILTSYTNSSDMFGSNSSIGRFKTLTLKYIDW